MAGTQAIQDAFGALEKGAQCRILRVSATKIAEIRASKRHGIFGGSRAKVFDNRDPM